MRTYRSGWVPVMPSSVLDRVDDTDGWGRWLSVAALAPDGADPGRTGWLRLGPWQRAVMWEPVRRDGGIRTWRAHDATGTVATLELVAVRWWDGSQVSIELEAPVAASVWAARSISRSLRRLQRLVTEGPRTAHPSPILRRAVPDEDHVSFA